MKPKQTSGDEILNKRGHELIEESIESSSLLRNLNLFLFYLLFKFILATELNLEKEFMLQSRDSIVGRIYIRPLFQKSSSVRPRELNK